MLAMHAWNDGIDDESRKLCEWAADTIRRIVSKNIVLSHRAEQAEGDASYLFHLHYGRQEGGAA